MENIYRFVYASDFFLLSLAFHFFPPKTFADKSVGALIYSIIVFSVARFRNANWIVWGKKNSVVAFWHFSAYMTPRLETRRSDNNNNKKYSWTGFYFSLVRDFCVCRMATSEKADGNGLEPMSFGEMYAAIYYIFGRKFSSVSFTCSKV